MTLKTRAVSAGLWDLTAVATQGFLQIGVMVILARCLSPSEFGLVAVAAIAVTVAAAVADVGVAPAVVQRPTLGRGDVAAGLALSWGLGLLMLFTLYTVSEPVARWFGQPEAARPLRWLAPTMLLNNHCSLVTAILERELRLRKAAVANITSYCIGFLGVGVPLALAGAGEWSLIAAFLVQSVARVVALGVPAVVPDWADIRWASIREIARFGLGSSLGKFLNVAATNADQAIVGRFLGAHPLGTYQLAFQIVDLPRRFVGSVLDRIVYSVMARAQDQPSRLRQAYLAGVSLNLLCMLPSAVLGVLLAPDGVVVLLGTQWTDMVLPLQIMLVQVPLRALVRMCDVACSAVGRVYSVAWRKGVYAGLVAVGAVGGAGHGLVGVAIGVSLATLANAIWMSILAARVVGVGYGLVVGCIAPSLLLAFVLLVVATGVRWTVQTAGGGGGEVLAGTVVAAATVVAGVCLRAPGLLGPSAHAILVVLGNTATKAWTGKGQDRL